MALAYQNIQNIATLYSRLIPIAAALCIYGCDSGEIGADGVFEGVDAGGIVRSRALEQLAVLWIAQSGAEGREHALGMLRR